ncbi:uncharacterized protein LOC121969695 isoform X2 [Zingiber officinale]|uniref:uncharacterized protein LOC121969695 isoform X2 n=1 Tax=Zingiber officinale TaxID=94328 RepID=UPI001C4DB49F|nr:uncharacterized protein LOC121969695 isoform X2 [Zingiber officinale]
MSFLFRKFLEAANVLAKSSIFTRDPRHLQFEADLHRLFLYTSYNRLGKNADENDIEEIIDMANKASVKDRWIQVQENVHFQFKNMCQVMDEILLSDTRSINGKSCSSSSFQNGPLQSELSFSVGKGTPNNESVVPVTQPMTRKELSQGLKECIGYTLDIRPSEIPHEEAGQGLFLDGEADAGSIIGFYPGLIYSPAYHRFIPGYPMVNASNTYLITRYDRIMIDGQTWGCGGEARELWDGNSQFKEHLSEESNRRSDGIWRIFSKPVEDNNIVTYEEVLERRNPLASAHFANHPPKGVAPNVMVCPYDFPLTEKDMRVYVPNLVFGLDQSVNRERFGTSWFKSGNADVQYGNSPVLKTIVLVATRDMCNEELFFNYMLNNQKKHPSWYTPVEVEDPC